MSTKLLPSDLFLLLSSATALFTSLLSEKETNEFSVFFEILHYCYHFILAKTHFFT